ncbi:MAG: MATE family efflux transporter, partial [Candidatus Diapherotrites archaeon]|nr:MATE family efflux transporter [Candidatus Diapherotrites archaeon]
KGNVSERLLKLTGPMFFGMVVMIIFNVVDTMYVAWLGVNELAAISFTFPVIAFFMAFSQGIGIAAAALVSKNIGKGEMGKVKEITGNSILIGVIFSIIFVIIGLITLEPFFKLLGAGPEIIPLIREYIVIWYIGVIVVMVAMIGNNIIRATGDTKTPMVIMVFAVLINIILDPFLIFGIWIFPKMGLAGAAWATLFSRMISLILALWVLVYRDKLFELKISYFKHVAESWDKIRHLAIPTIGVQLLMPIAMGIITSVMAFYGTNAVAAFGIISRIEFFIISPIIALSASLIPFVGQNFGAKQFDRVKQALSFSQKVSLVWGFMAFVFLVIFSSIIVNVFTSDVLTQSIAIDYFNVVSFGYGFF